MSSGIIEVKAKIRLLTKDEGGREKGYRSPIRPNHVFEYKDDEILETWIGEISFNDIDRLPLGTYKDVNIKFLKDRNIEKYIYPGRKWRIHEAQRLVGLGEIIEIL